MNNHLTTFEQSKKLKEIGVPQYGEGFYCNEKDSFFSPTENVAIGYKVVAFNFKRKNHIRQFALSELIEVLGDGFGGLRKRENDDMLGKWETHGFWGNSYHASTGEAPISSCVNLSLPFSQQDESLYTFLHKILCNAQNAK